MAFTAALDTVRQEPPGSTRRPPNGTEFVVTVRVTTEPGQSVRIARQIAETLNSVLGQGWSTSLEAVPTPRAANAAVTRCSVLEIDVRCRTVLLDGVALELTRLEFDLLLHLARDPGRVFGRAALLADVWHASATIHTRTVDVHIRRLRSKLGEHDRMISTVRNVGYRLEHDADVVVVE